jgi:hypothetical protein
MNISEINTEIGDPPLIKNSKLKPKFLKNQLKVKENPKMVEIEAFINTNAYRANTVGEMQDIERIKGEVQRKRELYNSSGNSYQ